MILNETVLELEMLNPKLRIAVDWYAELTHAPNLRSDVVAHRDLCTVPVGYQPGWWWLMLVDVSGQHCVLDSGCYGEGSGFLEAFCFQVFS